ncbi:hypothetical protein V5030_02080 [Moellerella wisconsensis]|uniref:hypothetical protein n=1 Tax=Moellerella wisconsensis TaxID=158849 RepID=UPI003076213A
MKSPRKNKIMIFNALLLIALAVISFGFSESITFKDIEPLISILQNTSAMIFTIMGIWIAYIYPNAILRITQPKKVKAIFSVEDAERIKLLVGIVILSAGVLMILLVGMSVRVFFIKAIFYLNNKYFFDSIAIFMFMTLVYIQLLCIYSVIASCVNFIIDINNLDAKRELSKKLDSGVKEDSSD